MREDLFEIQLKDIADLQNGFAFRSKDYVTISNTMNFRMSQIRPGGRIDLNHNPKFLPDNYFETHKEYKLVEGDVVIAMTDMASDTKILGVPTRVTKTELNLLLNQRVGKIFDINTSVISISYLRYILTSPQVYSNYKKLGKGGVQINLGKNDILNASFPLLSLPEQRAIVAKIEQLFSELDNGIANLKTAQKKLEIYRQAVLKKAFEGELTKTWREQQSDLPSADELLEQIKHERQRHYKQQLADWEKAVKVWEIGGKEGKKPRKPRKIKELSPILVPLNQKIPNHWLSLKIENFLSLIKKGMTTGPFGTLLKKSEHTSYGMPVLGIENIGEGIFKMPNKIFVSKEKAKELSSFEVELGDIIISRSGTVGEICAITKQIGKAYISTNLIRVSLNNNQMDSTYFVYLFQGGNVRKQVKKLCTGSTRDFLNQTILNSIYFPFPSLKEQTQIVHEIESRLSVCDKLSDTIKEQLKKAEALRQSILKKAFEGRLLSNAEIKACKQEDDWEPAEQLLARIKTEKDNK